MYHNFFSMLESTGHLNVHYVQKSFVKQNSICHFCDCHNREQSLTMQNRDTANIYSYISGTPPKPNCGCASIKLQQSRRNFCA